jgi:hypothetical protein
MPGTPLPTSTVRAVELLLDAYDTDKHQEQIMYELKDLDTLAAHFAHLLVDRLMTLSADTRAIQNSLREALRDYHTPGEPEA